MGRRCESPELAESASSHPSQQAVVGGKGPFFQRSVWAAWNRGYRPRADIGRR